MERAAFLTAWRERKLAKGVVMGLGAPAGNAATRIEMYVTKSGIYSNGVVPEIEDLYQRQARELDKKKREAMLLQIQQIMHERVLHVPVYELPDDRPSSGKGHTATISRILGRRVTQHPRTIGRQSEARPV